MLSGVRKLNADTRELIAPPILRLPSSALEITLWLLGTHILGRAFGAHCRDSHSHQDRIGCACLVMQKGFQVAAFHSTCAFQRAIITVENHLVRRSRNFKLKIAVSIWTPCLRDVFVGLCLWC